MSSPGDQRGVARAIRDFALSNKRPLTEAEIAEARTVFENTINYRKVQIADGLGCNDRPYTFYSFYYFGGFADYTLFLGPTDYAAMTDWATFIHEMTHVWQGQNHIVSSGYMLNSMISQAIDGDMAYNYTVGDFWGEYNVEQQAHLVEDWYHMDGRSTSSTRFPYIRDDIRGPLRAWASDLFIGIAAGAAAIKG